VIAEGIGAHLERPVDEEAASDRIAIVDAHLRNGPGLSEVE
jgi:hypothetical protein